LQQVTGAAAALMDTSLYEPSLHGWFTRHMRLLYIRLMVALLTVHYATGP